MRFEVVEYDPRTLDFTVLSTHPSSVMAKAALRVEQRLSSRPMTVLKRPEPPASVPVEVVLDLWDEFCGGTGYYCRGFLVSGDPALPFAFRYRDDHPICGTMLRGKDEKMDVHFLTLGLRTWKRELRSLWQHEFLDRAAVDPMVIQRINENVAKYLKKRPKRKRRISKKNSDRMRRWWFYHHKPRKGG